MKMSLFYFLFLYKVFACIESAPPLREFSVHSNYDIQKPIALFYFLQKKVNKSEPELKRSILV